MPGEAGSARSRPLHKKRLRKRGFNQAALLAEDLSRRLGILVDKEALVRTRDNDASEKTGKTGPEKKYHRCLYRFKKLPAGPDRTPRRRYLYHRKYHGMRPQKHSGRQVFKSLLFNDKYWTRIRIFVILKMMFRSQ